MKLYFKQRFFSWLFIALLLLVSRIDRICEF